MRFETYKKLFDTCVLPVLDYASAIWRFKHYQKVETVLHKYIKTFLGTMKTTPTPMILGDFGEYPLIINRKINMIKYWLHLISTPPDRLMRKVYKLDKLNNRNWCADIRSILKQCDMKYVYTSPKFIRTLNATFYG